MERSAARLAWARMIVDVRAVLAYRCPAETQAVVRVQAARTPDQRILSETLDLGGAALVESEAAGERFLRGPVAAGELRVDYAARVDNGGRSLIDPEAVQHLWAELPIDVYPYLLPSRYCPADKFLRFVARDFGGTTGGATALAILEWIHGHVDYIAGVSTASTSAEHTFADRAGVCRDFAHLAITLIRAAGIPARIVAAYAANLDPPDFHAVVEFYAGGRWWMADATRLVTPDSLIRIASGRDAADVAFLTTAGDVELIELSVMAAPGA